MGSGLSDRKGRVDDASLPVHAALVVAIAWSTALAAVIVGIASGQDWSHVLRLAITAAVYAPVAVILRGRSSAAAGIILGALAVLSGVLALVIMIAGTTDSSPGASSAVQIVAAAARLPEVAALAVMPWTFVTSAPRARTAGILLGLASILLDLSLFIAQLTGTDMPLGVRASPLALALVSFVLAGGVLAVQSRRASARERKALLWFAAGAILLVASYVRVVLVLPATAATFADAAFVLAQAILPTAILALAAEGRTAAPDRRIFSGVVHVQSLAFGVSLYLIVERVAAGAGVPSAIAGACGAGVLALTFSSMTGLIRRRTARLSLGETVDGREVLARLGDRLDEGGEHAGNGIRALAQSIRDIWGLSSVRISPASGMSAVVVGTPAPAAETIVLTTGGRAVAELEISDEDETVLRTQVLPVIAEVAALLGVAIALAVVNNDVAETRRRMLGVRREERRMLHRELLDGLAPALVGIGFGMAATGHRLAAGAPVRAELADLRAQVSSSASTVRALARALLPAALDAGDLDAALTELAQQLSTPRTTISVRSAGADVLASETQVTVYLMISGVLSLLTQETDATRISVHLEMSSDEVRIEAACVGPSGPRWPDTPPARKALARIVADAGATLEEPPGGETVRVVIRR